MGVTPVSNHPISDQYPRVEPITDAELQRRRHRATSFKYSVLCYTAAQGQREVNPWVNGERAWFLFDTKQFRWGQTLVTSRSWERTYYPFNHAEHLVVSSDCRRYPRVIIEFDPMYEAPDGEA